MQINEKSTSQESQALSDEEFDGIFEEITSKEVTPEGKEYFKLFKADLGEYGELALELKDANRLWLDKNAKLREVDGKKGSELDNLSVRRITESYQGELKELKEKIDKLQEDIVGLQNKIDADLLSEINAADSKEEMREVFQYIRNYMLEYLKKEGVDGAEELKINDTEAIGKKTADLNDENIQKLYQMLFNNDSRAAVKSTLNKIRDERLKEIETHNAYIKRLGPILEGNKNMDNNMVSAPQEGVNNTGEVKPVEGVEQVGEVPAEDGQVGEVATDLTDIKVDGDGSAPVGETVATDAPYNPWGDTNEEAKAKKAEAGALDSMAEAQTAGVDEVANQIGAGFDSSAKAVAPNTAPVEEPLPQTENVEVVEPEAAPVVPAETPKMITPEPAVESAAAITIDQPAQPEEIQVEEPIVEAGEPVVAENQDVPVAKEEVSIEEENPIGAIADQTPPEEPTELAAAEEPVAVPEPIEVNSTPIVEAEVTPDGALNNVVEGPVGQPSAGADSHYRPILDRINGIDGQQVKTLDDELGQKSAVGTDNVAKIAEPVPAGNIDVPVNPVKEVAGAADVAENNIEVPVNEQTEAAVDANLAEKTTLYDHINAVNEGENPNGSTGQKVVGIDKKPGFLSRFNPFRKPENFTSNDVNELEAGAKRRAV